MALTVENLKCPNCGAALAIDNKICKYCHNPVTITSFHSIADMPAPKVNKYASLSKKKLEDDPENQELNFSLGTCYLKLKLYDKALAAFEIAMEDNFDNSETFFCAAMCLLQGKKPFLHNRQTINKIQEYINAALMIEERGIYYYFLAYIKKDYFERKYLNVSPNFAETMQTANSHGVSEADKKILFDMLGVERPAEM